MRVIIIAMALCAATNFTKADYCQDNFTFADMPYGLFKEVISLVTFGTIGDFFGCFGNTPVSRKEVNFWFYSRDNPTDPILLDPEYPAEIFPNKKIIFLVPGWLCNVTNDRMPQLRDAYLKRYDANIIGIDWTARSISLYIDAFCSIPYVAKLIGSFLCHISNSLDIDLGDIHMVGHSMGGQISGLTGQEVQSQCNKKLGRITGLDPAGPLYQFLPENERLDASDADFVDVIHTNMAFLGYWGDCGTMDFYPNCGTFQPGCLRLDRITSPSDIINLPLTVASCNHLRAVDYMVQSINSRNLSSQSCEICPGLKFIGPCFADESPSNALMGEDSSPSSESSKFYLETN